MPIGPFEREVLRVIARNRNPDSYIGGATVLHQAPQSPRTSRDLDIFHDTAESVTACFEADAAALQAAGFDLELEKPQEAFRRAFVRREDQATKLDWVYDSAFRFFPVEPDPELGYRLSFWDAGTNKILALFGRHEFRDYVDVHFLHRDHLHLGAWIWAAAGKDPGLTPELILDWVRRNSFYSPDQVAAVNLSQALDLREMKRLWLQAAEEAEALIGKLPIEQVGCFYLNPLGRPVCPDPSSSAFKTVTPHFGSIKGAWPRIVGEG